MGSTDERYVSDTISLWRRLERAADGRDVDVVLAAAITFTLRAYMVRYGTKRADGLLDLLKLTLERGHYIDAMAILDQEDGV